jgi:hypothetical protein
MEVVLCSLFIRISPLEFLLAEARDPYLEAVRRQQLGGRPPFSIELLTKRT